MTPLAFLALTLALAAAPAPVRTVRAVAVSGTPQSARAYVGLGEAKYVTDFPALLVVRVEGLPPAKAKRHVRFRCVTKGCVFAPADQPNEGKGVEHVDPPSYDAEVGGDGRAAIRVALETDGPTGTYTIVAEPVAQKGERAVSAPFTLTTR